MTAFNQTAMLQTIIKPSKTILSLVVMCLVPQNHGGRYLIR